MYVLLSHYKISGASNDSSLQKVFQEDDMSARLIEAGYSKSLYALSLNDASGMGSTLLTFHLFLKVKAVMDQFKEGLEMAGLLPFMTKYADLMRPLFVDETCCLTASKCTQSSSHNTHTHTNRTQILTHTHTHIPTTDDVKEMLVPTFSDKGTTKRPKEEQTYVHFCDFLDHYEGDNNYTRNYPVLVFTYIGLLL